MQVGDKMVSSKRKKVLKKTEQIVSFNINDTVLDGVLFVLDNRKTWTGTMTELKQELSYCLGKKRDLPRSPGALRIVLNRVINRIRTRGISVKFKRATNHTRTRYVTFVRR
jgi:hypothetical protein